jgi:hypothetical protein
MGTTTMAAREVKKLEQECAEDAEKNTQRRFAEVSRSLPSVCCKRGFDDEWVDAELKLKKRGNVTRAR